MPLRPELYRRLTYRFNKVLIANEGEAMHAKVTRSALTGKATLDVIYAGEYYRINCCFCGDTRQRLWINHLWGYYHPEAKSRLLHLATCFNEQCLQRPGNLKWLDLEVNNDFCRDADDIVLPAKPPTQQRAFAWPGDVQPLTDLADDHRAITYLRERGFDPVQLSQELGVGFCTHAAGDFYPAQGRIIIPVQMHGKLIGWQARHVGHYDSFKYWSMPGWKKSLCLYNYDKAKHSPYVLICEGVTDVWRAGPAAVALFGKTLSNQQRQLIASTWKNGTAVILLDGDAQKDAQKINEQLAGLVRHRLIVPLPDGCDPGDCTAEELSNLILTYANMAHPRKSATQQRKNNPRSRLGFLDIPLSFVFVRAFSSCFVLAL